jgi:HYR domain
MEPSPKQHNRVEFPKEIPIMKSPNVSGVSKSAEFGESQVHFLGLIPRVAALVMLVGLVASIFYAGSSASSANGVLKSERSEQSSKTPAVRSLLSGPASLNRIDNSMRSFLPVPQPFAETIQTFAQDCSTPKTTFLAGETVCAKTDGVDLNYAGGRWVDWILTGNTNTILSGSRTTTLITTNPQTFTYAATAAGVYKVEITQDFNGQDDPQTPAVFTVTTPAFATYASNCSTPQSSFNLGQTVCIKVNGLSNDEFPRRRVQLSSPDGFVMARLNINDNSVQLNYTIPSATTETIDGQTIDHRGTWGVSLIDLDADIHDKVSITVHTSNLLVDRVADLQISKVLLLDPSDPPPTAGTNITFQLLIINQGPDPATNVRLSDITLPNTTFQSFNRVSILASNIIPNSNFGTFFPDSTFLNSDLMRFAVSPGSSALSNTAYPNASFLLPVQETPITFNCVSPSVGGAGTTNCTTSGEIAVGETALFTAVYKVNANVANGAELKDDNSASVNSDTTDQFTSSNSQPATVNTSNPSPPACTITCPNNFTVGTNAVNGQGQPGAIITFDAGEPGGSCGTVSATPPSGSFFPVGNTTITTNTGSGASCNFTITVVNNPQPTISCPSNKTATASGSQGEASVAVGTPTFTGSLATITGARNDERDVSESYPIGTTTITWTVRDQYDTTASCIQTVTVTSADAPTISCPSDKTFAAAAGDCQKTLTAPQIGTPTVGGLNTTYDYLRSDHQGLTDPYPAGQTTITWTATNAVGSASCTQLIMITTTGDTTPPVLTIPADINISTAECSVLLDDELGIATATDDCTPAVNITRTGLPQIPCPIPGNLTRTCDSFFFPTGSTNITYTATDAAGNAVTAVQHINIAENPVIFPTITAPASLTGTSSINTLATDTTCGTFVGDATLGSATASDNCPGVTITRTGVPAGNIFPVGDTVINYTATDRTNHSTSATQTVTVVDKTPPTIAAPANVIAYTGATSTTCDTVVSDTTLGTPTVGDNCPGTVGVSRSPSGNTFAVGTTNVTWTATDAHGNTATAIQTVTVIDDTPPVITTNGQTPSMWPPNHTYQTFNVTTFVTSVSDNCGGVAVSDVIIDKVTSDEAENGNGSGNTVNDIVIAADKKSVQLRSEREGGGNGRVYTITFKLTDTHGNPTTVTSKVVVPHNTGQTAVDSGVHYCKGSCP